MCRATQRGLEAVRELQTRRKTISHQALWSMELYHVSLLILDCINTKYLDEIADKTITLYIEHFAKI